VGCDVESVSRNRENYQTIDKVGEKPSRHYLNPTIVFTVSG